MKKIQMVDLQTQYQHIKEDIDRGIQAVIDSASFIKGPAVASFQSNLEQYTGAKHVIPVGNGTDALQIALMALGKLLGMITFSSCPPRPIFPLMSGPSCSQPLWTSLTLLCPLFIFF